VLSEEDISSNVAGKQAILGSLLQPNAAVPGSPPAVLNNLVSIYLLLRIIYDPTVNFDQYFQERALLHSSPPVILNDLIPTSQC